MVVLLSYVSLLLKANVRDVFGFIDKQNQADPSVWHMACQLFFRFQYRPLACHSFLLAHDARVKERGCDFDVKSEKTLQS